ncbi:MAG TPA: hypothetical protein PK228_18940 [Saprospiraceae bacterium]|nr:hypothetical protein [Saprospiraceae bacterium]
MIYRAFFSNTQALLSKPETGMGYQIIEARISGQYSFNKYIVYNAELIVELDNEFDKFKRQIELRGFSNILAEVRYLNLENSSIALSVNASSVFEGRNHYERKSKAKNRYTGGKGAKEGQIEKANGSEPFVRLSAYENDMRIDLNKRRLLPGSYTTTQVDYEDCLKYDDDPVDRYALPNDEKIKWAFYVLPKNGDNLQRGIVQPAFDHDGGGIEAYFEYGTSENTYKEKISYGK